ncbi:MAG: SdrD B-like domain-containing protein [Actinomycetota bacterium]|nr:SdrD B-like domain-containing protein [Actinomycetota bacterium]
MVNRQNYGSISGYKYEDSDGDGSTTDDLTGISGWVIELWKSPSGSYDDLVLATSVTTDSDGIYSFTDVIPGYYRIKEVILTGWTNLVSAVIDIFVDSNEQEVGHNFVNFKKATIKRHQKNVVGPRWDRGS